MSAKQRFYELGACFAFLYLGETLKEGRKNAISITAQFNFMVEDTRLPVYGR